MASAARRRRAPAPLDCLARHLEARRSTVAVLVPLVGALGFGLLRLIQRPAVAGDSAALDALAQALSAANRFPPLLIGANLVMALPLVAGLRRALDRRAWAGLGALALWSYVIEGIGLRTGWPYGEFRYTQGLEPLLWGTVPLALPLFWLPMLVSARLLTWLVVSAPSSPRGRSRELGLVGVAIVLTVLLDAILDPGAVGLGFWAYAHPGVYYGVPWSNFAGWALSSLVGQLILAAALPARRLDAADPPPLAWDSLRAFLVFWALINLFLGQFWPLILALGFILLAIQGNRKRQPESQAKRVKERINLK